MDINEIIALYENASEEIRTLAEQILREGLQHPDIPVEHSETIQQMRSSWDHLTCLGTSLPF